jgi:polygalacturonase
VCEFGTVGDGVTTDTAAIQAAIDSCAGCGGGTVSLGPGTYLAGTVRLKDNVTLHLEAGATLLGSTDLNDYTDHYVDRSLIYAEGAANIAITGRGVIDGQGAAFRRPPAAESKEACVQADAEGNSVENEDKENWLRARGRPFLLRLVDCTNVLLHDITVRNSAMWCLDFLACDSLLIDGIRLRSRDCNENNDGIDLEDCRNVRIANCDIQSGDDAICLKSTTSDGVCENIAISNCLISSGQSAIKTGTDSIGGFRDILVSNCVIYDSSRAVALDIYDGGVLERVGIQNLTLRNVVVAISCELFDRGRTVDPTAAKPSPGIIRDLIISQVQGTGITDVACLLAGLPGHPLRDVTLQSIRLRGPGRESRINPWTQRPVRALCDCSRIDGLRLNDIDLLFAGDGITETPLSCEEGRNLSVAEVRHNGCNVTIERGPSQ